MNGTGSIPSGYGLYLLQTILALGAVCLLAYVVLRVLAKRIHGIGRQGKLLRVVEHLPLDQRRTLYVIEVEGRRLLVGGSDSGVALIAEIGREREGEREGEQEGEREAEGEATRTRKDRSQDPG